MIPTKGKDSGFTRLVNQHTVPNGTKHILWACYQHTVPDGTKQSPGRVTYIPFPTERSRVLDVLPT